MSAISGRQTPVADISRVAAVSGVLLRFDRGDEPRVRRGLTRMGDDIADTAQGRAWPCLPHSTGNWRGPGRRADFCPMVTLQALRTFARVPQSQRPPNCSTAPASAARVADARNGEALHVLARQAIQDHRRPVAADQVERWLLRPS